MDYNEYLLSEDYASRRIACLERDDYTCQLCREKNPKCGLNVHHITYDRLGHEDPDDLITLCRDCHEKLSEAIRISKSFFSAYTEQYKCECAELLLHSEDLKQISIRYIDNLTRTAASALEMLDREIPPEKRVSLVHLFTKQFNTEQYRTSINPNSYTPHLYQSICQELKKRRLQKEVDDG